MKYVINSLIINAETHQKAYKEYTRVYKYVHQQLNKVHLLHLLDEVITLVYNKRNIGIGLYNTLSILPNTIVEDNYKGFYKPLNGIRVVKNRYSKDNPRLSVNYEEVVYTSTDEYVVINNRCGNIHIVKAN